MTPTFLLKRSINRTSNSAHRRLESHHSRALSFAVPSNANNIAVALPVEILHAIFAFCAGDSHPIVVTRRPRYRPNWVTITHVCQRWRAVALEFKKLWYTITPDLSPKWISAFLERSSHAPKHVNIDVGPPPKKPPKKRRFGTRRRPAQKPLMTLPSEVMEEVLSHASRIESLHFEGNTVDVVRTLTSLDGTMPLSSLSLNLWDEFKYPHIVDSWDEDERRDASLILPETIFGGTASRLRRLQVRSALHVVFPSWVLRTISEFSISCSFCPNRLFTTLCLMPQLEVLRVSPTRRYSFLLHSDGFTAPVNLKHLSLLVVEDVFLELVTTLLDCLVVPANVRRHLKLRLDESKFDTSLWGRFSTLIRDVTSGSPDPLRGIHFRREPSSTNIRIWASPCEPGLVPSPWPPLDDPFSLEIHCADRSCLYGLHTSYSVSSFHRLQELCVSLGGQTVQELFVEYGTEPESRRRPAIPHRCWRTLFSGLASLNTLQFGDGAAELLVSASYGGSVGPKIVAADSAALPCRGSLSGNVHRVIISRSAFSTRILWNWIHYAFARPPEADAYLLRKNVLALLWEPRWKSADIDPVEDVTESLLIFLLYCRPMGVQLSELSLVKSTWDEPGGLEILQRLLHMLDPDRNAIVEAAYPG